MWSKGDWIKYKSSSRSTVDWCETVTLESGKTFKVVCLENSTLSQRSLGVGEVEAEEKINGSITCL